MSLRRLFDRLYPQCQDEPSVAIPSDSKHNEEPPAKKQKKIASDRITLDVGGTKFVAGASTLKANSTYFASLPSDNWIESNHENEGMFLDQDPVAFGKLLAYMRRGMVKVDEIDTDVLALAEFLGIEGLVLAVKVRWYCNIGKGPVLFQDEETENTFDQEIAAAFDQEYGGILKAISNGLFPFFLKQDDVNAEKDFAVMVIVRDRSEEAFESFRVQVQEVGKGNMGHLTNCGGTIGALNGLHANGYTLDEDQIHHEFSLGGYDITRRFSRMRHSNMRTGSATDIFIPTEDEIEEQIGSNCIKQFALHIKYCEGGSEKFIMPAEFGDDPNPYAEAASWNIDDDGGCLWPEQNNFITREKKLEEHSLFKWNRWDGSSDGATGGLYSRQISRVQRRK